MHVRPQAHLALIPRKRIKPQRHNVRPFPCRKASEHSAPNAKVTLFIESNNAVRALRPHGHLTKPHAQAFVRCSEPNASRNAVIFRRGMASAAGHSEKCQLCSIRKRDFLRLLSGQHPSHDGDLNQCHQDDSSNDLLFFHVVIDRPIGRQTR